MKDFQSTLAKCALNEIEYVVLGASAGGVEALKTVFSHLGEKRHLKFSLVLHMPATGLNLMGELLHNYCSWEINEATSGEVAKPGSITLAAPDYHLSLERNGSYSLSSEELVNYSRPSIDVLFESAAYAFKEKTLGILLTGANQDGAQGLKKIQDFGGVTIVQDPTTAICPHMPQSALDLMRPDEILTLQEISDFLNLLTSGDSYA